MSVPLIVISRLRSFWAEKVLWVELVASWAEKRENTSSCASVTGSQDGGEDVLVVAVCEGFELRVRARGIACWWEWT